MGIVCLHQKGPIEAFLRRTPILQIYALGDLDDFFWPNTTWYALEEEGRIEQLVLLYTGGTLPVLLAFAEEPLEPMRRLLRGIVPFLPAQVYAHLSGDLVREFESGYRIRSHGPHLRMGLTARAAPEPWGSDRIDPEEAAGLTAADLPELEEFYRESYPGSWFVPRMLETGLYFGLRRGGRLVSVAGVHVHSAAYRVAALGNVATHPDWRGQGLARAACARLCGALRASADHIALNVKADNHSAIACYESLGFRRAALYHEYLMEYLPKPDAP